MVSSDCYPALAAITRATVERVADDPEDRYRLCEQFYRAYGFGQIEYGFGNSELAFMRWEIERGVLNPASGPSPGSPWWRAVNSELLFTSTCAGLVHHARCSSPSISHEVQCWLDYIANPSSRTWYRAHNASIIHGYALARTVAYAEERVEQVFMNEVLYRVLYAEAMTAGSDETFGLLGEILADPKLPVVDIVTHIQSLYPVHYPLTLADKLRVLHRYPGVQELAADIMDEVLILPHIQSLYHFIAEETGEPEVEDFLRRGKPVYPDTGVVKELQNNPSSRFQRKGETA